MYKWCKNLTYGSAVSLLELHSTPVTTAVQCNLEKITEEVKLHSIHLCRNTGFSRPDHTVVWRLPVPKLQKWLVSGHFPASVLTPELVVRMDCSAALCIAKREESLQSALQCRAWLLTVWQCAGDSPSTFLWHLLRSTRGSSVSSRAIGRAPSSQLWRSCGVSETGAECCWPSGSSLRSVRNFQWDSPGCAGGTCLVCRAGEWESSSGWNCMI